MGVADISGKIMGLLYLLAFLHVLACVVAGGECGGSPPYTELYFEQFVDHFNYENDNTYQERYLVSGTIV